MLKRSILLPAGLIASLFIFVLCLLVLLLVPSYRPVSQIWKGYYTILISDSEMYEELLKLQFRPPASFPIVSEDATFVRFSTFDGLSRVRVNEIDSRFDSKDPRVDPYMISLRHFFGADGGWERIFVLTRLPAFHFFLKMYFEFPGYGTKWRIADYNLSSKFISILLSIAFFLVIIHLKHGFKLRLIAVLGYLPWLLSLVSGDNHDLISFFLLYSAWYLVFDEVLDFLKQYLFYGWRDADLSRLKSRSLYLGVAFLLTTILRIPSSNAASESLRNFVPLLADLCLAAPYLLVIFVRRWRSDHLTFSPVPIKSEKRGLPVNKILLIPLCGLLMLSPLLIQVANPGVEGSVPVPHNPGGEQSFTWESLGNIWDDKSEGDLPNISDYVAHMVYQIGLSYGQDYSFPSENHSFTISTFSENGGQSGISKMASTVQKLDDDWLEEILAQPQVGSLERMLLDQGAPLRVVLVPLKFFQPKFAGWKFGILFLFAFFALLAFDLTWAPVLFYSNFRLGQERRQRAA